MASNTFNDHQKSTAGGNPDARKKSRPPDREILTFAHSMRTLSSLPDIDIIPLSRLTSANHDLIVHPAPHPNALIRFLRWWKSWAVPGMGIFAESYIIFSIGNIHPLLAIDYPNCYGKAEPPDCNRNAVEQDKTIEICGIIAGMLILGYFADLIGRKWGSRLTISFMLAGGILLCSAAGSAQAAMTVLITGLFIFGLGVGGEYPLSASSAAERAEGDPKMRKRRGETVVLTFSQQGWGNFSNTLVILLFMAILGATGSVVSEDDAALTWRLQFIVGTVIAAGTAFYRWKYLEESKVWEAEKKKSKEEEDDQGPSSSGLYKVMLKRNWSRLLATCGAWLLNDLAFYGHKLYQSKFIEIISPGAPLFKRYQWTLLNSAVALVGYFFAAFFIDKPYYGRKRMQFVGFAMMFALFLACGLAFNELTTNYIDLFQFLYFFASFWNQFGPNCVTFLVAGEVFPTDVRAFFHGVSAAAGKVGALIATQTFSRLSTQNVFYVSAASGAAGALCTFLFLPDTTGLDLAELDRLKMYLMAGQEHNYHGEAVNPKYLSVFERWMGYGKAYDPDADKEHEKLQGMGKDGISVILEDGDW